MSPENSEVSRMLQEQAELEAAMKELTSPQQEQAKYWLERIKAEQQTKAPEHVDKEQIASELDAIFNAWLVPEKLEPLHALTTEAEAMASPLRAEAKVVLGGILKRIKVLGDPPEPKDKYKILSRAAGIINNGLVDHTR